MRLIDADDLLDVLDKVEQDCENACIIPSWSMAVEEIKRQPTAYDVDKVVEQLENERKFWENAYDSNLGKEKARSYEHAIEIVKGGGADE